MVKNNNWVDKNDIICQLCMGDTRVGMYAKVGHDLVLRVDGHNVVAERTQSDHLTEDVYEQIGRRFFHGGGPALSPGQKAFTDLSERFAKEEILPRINDEITEEHSGNPIGKHSDDLQRVLHYFRRMPNDGKYVVVETERSEEWSIGILSDERGVAPEVTDETFNSPEAAEHEIFLKRVSEFQETYQE